MIALLLVYVASLVGWSLFRIRALLSEHKNKEAAAYGCLMGFCGVLGCLLIGQVELPSFVVPAEMLLEPIGKMLLKH